MQLVIPMSGSGKRFQEKGYRLPKPLIPISGKPIVQHVIEMYPGVEDILFIVNRKHFEDPELQLEKELRKFAPEAQIAVIDSHNLGPAWAIKEASEYIDQGSSVVVNYCDFSCLWDFNAFRSHLESGIDGLIATYTGFHPHMLRNSKYAYLSLDDSGRLTDIREKLSFTLKPMSEPASSGTYGFATGKLLIRAIENQISNGDSFNDEFYMSLTYKNMISSGLDIRNFEIEKFFQWGTPEDFEDFKWQKEFFTRKSTNISKDIDVDRIEIVAAGEGKRFSRAGYQVVKPCLPVGEDFLATTALNSLGEPMHSKGILLQKGFAIPDRFGKVLSQNHIKIRWVEGLTKGQAQSALIALAAESAGSCIVGTCDSLVFPGPQFKSPRRGKIIYVWVTRPTEYAGQNPEQFGWVNLDRNGKVIETWVKERPFTKDETYVITGTFYFGDDVQASSLIRTFLDEGEAVNGEFYLDSLLGFAAQAGWEVFGLIPDMFVSLGTPEEYETYRYWESVFHFRPDLLVNDD
jgi:NDP-sugar pyrophosphorylase family protein